METINFTAVIPEIENVKRKIKRLLAMTPSNGCSEGEALNAATLVGKLLTQYDLTLDKVLLDAEKCIQGTVVTNRSRRHPIDLCIVDLADFCSCKVWLSEDHTGQVYKFFGLESDVMMAQYLYGVIYQSIEHETKWFKQSLDYKQNQLRGYHGRGLTLSFQKGMASRIAKRMRELQKERWNNSINHKVTVVHPTTGMTTETSLVYIKRDRIQDEFERLNLHLRRVQSVHRISNFKAYAEGQSAGNKVNLNRPVEGKSSIAGYLR